MKNAPGNEMVLLLPIFNISLQPTATAARNFERGFLRLNRTQSYKEIKEIRWKTHPEMKWCHFYPFSTYLHNNSPQPHGILVVRCYFSLWGPKVVSLSCIFDLQAMRRSSGGHMTTHVHYDVLRLWNLRIPQPIYVIMRHSSASRLASKKRPPPRVCLSTATAAQNFVRGFLRLNRTRLLKKIKEIRWKTHPEMKWCYFYPFSTYLHNHSPQPHEILNVDFVG